MKRVSIKGIAIGIFCDLFLSLILGIGLTIAFVDSSLINQPPERLEAALLKLSNSNRSEEHTSELQSHLNLVCRLLLEKKKQADKLALATTDSPAKQPCC